MIKDPETIANVKQALDNLFEHGPKNMGAGRALELLMEAAKTLELSVVFEWYSGHGPWHVDLDNNKVTERVYQEELVGYTVTVEQLQPEPERFKRFSEAVAALYMLLKHALAHPEEMDIPEGFDVTAAT